MDEVSTEMPAGMARHRVADIVTNAAYGCVLTLATLSAATVADVDLGHGAELVGGVGLASWAAHLFAEFLGGRVRRGGPMRATELGRAAVDSCPIIVSTLLPAVVLLLGRLGVLDDGVARALAIVVAEVQLIAIAVAVARLSDARRGVVWAYAGAVAVVGLADGALIAALGH